MRNLLAAVALAAGLSSGAACAATAADNAYLYIGWPTDGQVLSAGRPFRVWFGLRNMGVAPKGVAFSNTGHHHLLIDTECRRPGRKFHRTATSCTSAPAKRKPRSNCRPANPRCSY
jgi:hypothetical protein